VDFYWELHTKGTSRAKALRREQANLRADPRHAHPYYWAPFTLVNDWLELQAGERIQRVSSGAHCPQVASSARSQHLESRRIWHPDSV
jgi:hypothetical protein